MKDDLVKTMLVSSCETLWQIQNILGPVSETLSSLNNSCQLQGYIKHVGGESEPNNLTDEQNKQISLSTHLLREAREEIRTLIYSIGFVIGKKAMYKADHTADE